jgi:hypothetical protein
LFKGVNVFLLKDWIMPIEELGTDAFNAFDESLGRLRSDPNATRIQAAPTRAAAPDRDVVFTATQAALRAIPERYRASAELYTLSIARRQAHANLPPWCSITLETKEGELSLLSNAIYTAREWVTLPIEDNDSLLHVSLFSQNPVLSSSDESTIPRFARLATLIGRPDVASRAATMSLKI